MAASAVRTVTGTTRSTRWLTLTAPVRPFLRRIAAPVTALGAAAVLAAVGCLVIGWLTGWQEFAVAALVIGILTSRPRRCSWSAAPPTR